MSSNQAHSDEIPKGQDEPETGMADPENYGSLTIEDPDGGDNGSDSPDEPIGAEKPSDQ